MSTGLASLNWGRKRCSRKRLAAWAVFFLILVACGALLAQEASDKAASAQETVYEPGRAGVTIPKAIYQPNPEYTDKARRKKLQGTVLVGMVVTADGTVRDVNVIKSLEASLDKQAIACVSKWKFQPATKDGEPVAVHVKAEVDFHLY
jgi:TonB family protein